jgi:hypothetical protein
MASNYKNLPYDLLIEIFKYLPNKDLVAASEVCPSWEEACSDPAVWKYPKIEVEAEKLMEPNSSEETLTMIKRILFLGNRSIKNLTCTNVYSLAFNVCMDGIEEHCMELRRLSLGGNILSYLNSKQVLRLTNSCPQITALDIHVYDVEAMDLLRRLPCIKRLTIHVFVSKETVVLHTENFLGIILRSDKLEIMNIYFDGTLEVKYFNLELYVSVRFSLNIFSVLFAEVPGRLSPPIRLNYMGYLEQTVAHECDPFEICW